MNIIIFGQSYSGNHILIKLEVCRAGSLMGGINPIESVSDQIGINNQCI